MADDLGGFYFDVERFLGSTAVRRMSCSELGVYILMLCHQWLEKSKNLPDDPHAVAEMIAVTPGQVAEVVAAWEIVRRKFVASDHTPGRIWNITMENTRRKQRAYRRKKSDDGRKGGKASAAKRQQEQELVVNDRSTTVQPPSSVMSSYVVSSDDLKSDEVRGSDLPDSGDPPLAVFPTIGQTPEWALSPTQQGEWQGLYVGVDVAGELRKALAWVKANPTKRKTARGMPAFLVSWLNRAAAKGPRLAAVGGVSETARYNAEAFEEAQRIIHGEALAGTGTHGHRR